MSRTTRNFLGLTCTAVAALSMACTYSSNRVGDQPQVGDTKDGGTVTQVNGDEDCSIVTIQYDASWECTEDQKVLAQTYPGYIYDNGGGGTGGSVGEPATTVQLRATDCEGLAELRRPALKQSQQQTIDMARYQLLADKCFAKTETRYYAKGDQVSYCSVGYYDGATSGSTGSGSGGSATVGAGSGTGGGIALDPSEDEGATDYSTTNNQVADVDEADFVKNDSGHVYVLSTDGLHVIDAWPAPETHEIAHVPLPGEPRRLFLEGDKLVVYTRLPGATGSSDYDYYGGGDTSSPSGQGCTYGYDCRFSSEGGHTLVLVYDVSDPAQPQILHRYEMSGGYVASRRVGSFVYTVVLDGDRASVPGVDLTLKAESPEELDENYAALKKSSEDAVDDAPASAFLPWIHKVAEDGAPEGTVDACDNALAAEAAKGTSFVSVVGFDLDTLAEPTRTLVAGKAGYVYASASALYLATDGVDGSDYIYHSTAANDQSTVHKFAFDGASTSYRGSVAIAGHVLNQFAMDELDGVLRVATSTGWVPDPAVSSNLITIGEKDGTLAKIGHLGGIAPTEDIRSVRFDGTRGFVVTFKKTDPLFVFDLTDPAEPTVLGELKIPGFSTYMHPLDADHLLAIGFDADDQGDFAYFDGIQLQIFDVTELTNPLLMHKTTIGTRGSGSEALMNHLAFNYFPSQSLLAMPMTICEGGDNGVYGDKLTFSGLMVFDVSLETGITERGRMPFVDAAALTADSNSTAAASCGTWWTNSTSDVKRSIFMDEYTIGISDTLYQVAPTDDLDGILQKLPLVATP